MSGGAEQEVVQNDDQTGVTGFGLFKKCVFVGGSVAGMVGVVTYATTGAAVGGVTSVAEGDPVGGFLQMEKNDDPVLFVLI